MSVNRDIYRAVHERKWLSVEYLNGQGRTTRYWVGVKDIDPRQRTLRVRGMHLGSYTVKNLTIRVDGIESSSLIDESYFPTPPEPRVVRAAPASKFPGFSHAAEDLLRLSDGGEGDPDIRQVSGPAVDRKSVV